MTDTQTPSFTRVSEFNVDQFRDMGSDVAVLREIRDYPAGTVVLFGRNVWYEFLNSIFAFTDMVLYEGAPYESDFEAPFAFIEKKDEGRILIYTESYLDDEECRVPPNSIYVKKH